MQSQQTLITSESLELGAELGQGEFGSVLKGVWTDPKGGKVTCLRTVPTIVTVLPFRASQDSWVSYGWCLLIQE